MNTKNTPPPDDHKKYAVKNHKNNEIQSLQEKQNSAQQINESSAKGYHHNAVAKEPVVGCSDSRIDRDDKSERNRPANVSASNSTANPDSDNTGGLSQIQQQFVLRFCRQLASVIVACEQSESAEIEVGRRHIDASQVKVKLQAEREYSDETG